VARFLVGALRPAGFAGVAFLAAAGFLGAVAFLAPVGVAPLAGFAAVDLAPCLEDVEAFAELELEPELGRLRLGVALSCGSALPTLFMTSPALSATVPAASPAMPATVPAASPAMPATVPTTSETPPATSPTALPTRLMVLPASGICVVTSCSSVSERGAVKRQPMHGPCRFLDA
jgi:hypothetical protein